MSPTQRDNVLANAVQLYKTLRTYTAPLTCGSTPSPAVIPGMDRSHPVTYKGNKTAPWLLVSPISGLRWVDLSVEHTVIDEKRWPDAPPNPEPEPNSWNYQRYGQYLGDQVDGMQDIVRVFEVGYYSRRRRRCTLYRKLLGGHRVSGDKSPEMHNTQHPAFSRYT